MPATGGKRSTGDQPAHEGGGGKSHLEGGALRMSPGVGSVCAKFCNRPGRTEVQKKDFPLKCYKKKLFLAILGLPSRNDKKCPKMPFGASWQPPRKMSKKCLENVLVLGLALEKCPENVKKMSQKCPETFSRHFFYIFWPIENQKEGARARAREARAPPFGWRPKAATSQLAKKCQKNDWKMSLDIFGTFF